MDVLAAISSVLGSHTQNRTPQTRFEVEVLKQIVVLEARHVVSIHPRAVLKDARQEFYLSDGKRLQPGGVVGSPCGSRLNSDN
jgi:hypothetical protein